MGHASAAVAQPHLLPATCLSRSEQPRGSALYSQIETSVRVSAAGGPAEACSLLTAVPAVVGLSRCPIVFPRELSLNSESYCQKSTKILYILRSLWYEQIVLMYRAYLQQVDVVDSIASKTQSTKLGHVSAGGGDAGECCGGGCHTSISQQVCNHCSV